MGIKSSSQILHDKIFISSPFLEVVTQGIMRIENEGKMLFQTFFLLMIWKRYRIAFEYTSKRHAAQII